MLRVPTEENSGSSFRVPSPRTLTWSASDLSSHVSRPGGSLAFRKGIGLSVAIAEKAERRFSLTEESFAPVCNLAKHIENLESVRPTSGLSGFAEEFQALMRKTSGAEFVASQGGYKAGFLECNMRKNRYADIVPLETTRVLLQGSFSDGTDYINANFIDGESGVQRAYIAAQAPTEHTVEDFWRAVWECSVSILVMLTDPVDPEIPEYWPPARGQTVTIGRFKLTWTLSDPKPCMNLRLFVLLDTRTGASRIIHHIHYLRWPDCSAPDVESFYQLLTAVDELRHGSTNPVLVHCKAGIGRTGVFCVIDSIIQDLKRSWAHPTNISSQGGGAGVHQSQLGMSLNSALLGPAMSQAVAAAMSMDSPTGAAPPTPKGGAGFDLGRSMNFGFSEGDLHQLQQQQQQQNLSPQSQQQQLQQSQVFQQPQLQMPQYFKDDHELLLNAGNPQVPPPRRFIAPSISVLSVARRVRMQRIGMIQNEEQYVFIYRFLQEWLAMIDRQYSSGKPVPTFSHLGNSF